MAKSPKEQPHTLSQDAAKSAGNRAPASPNWTEIDTTGMTPEEIAATAESAILAKKGSRRNKISQPNQKGPENTAKHPHNVKSKPSEGEKATIGRPSKFTQELADHICAELMEGKSLRRICMAENMPNRSTVFLWLASNESFSDQYARAREIQGDTYFDEAIDIADDGQNDTYEDADGNKRTDMDVIARSRLRVDTRKWAASKLRPKKYGDRIDVDHGVQKDNPLAALLAQVAGTALPVIKDADEE